MLPEENLTPLESKLSWKIKSLLFFGGIIVVAAATLGGYFFSQYKNKTEPTVYDNNVLPTKTPFNGEPAPVTTSEPVYEDAGTSVGLVFATTSLPQDMATQIIWLKPKLVEKLGWLNEDFLPTSSPQTFPTSKYYEIGNFMYQGEKGKVVLLEFPGGLGLGGPNYFYVIDFKKQLVVLAKYPWQNRDEKSYYNDPAETLKWFADLFTPNARQSLSMDYNFTIAALEFPKVLKGPKERQVLVWKGTYPIQPEFGFGTLVVIDQAFVFADANFGKVYMSAATGGFYLHGPDDSWAAYAVEPDFFNKNNALAQIIWNDGSWNGYEYIYGDQGGCGFTNYISVVTSTDITLKNDLEIIGKTSKGDTIYELKNKNHRLLKTLYENAYFPQENGYKVSYEEYVTLKPVIFWVDPFDRLIKMQNKRFIIPAECGKPVIYLYPEQTTDVSVTVEPKGGMTVSDPFYNGGWQVKADPSGQLTELKSGKQYPYLFWEGTGDLYQAPEKGFMVKRENVSREIPEKLKQLGLNQNEIKDFMEFWYPRMQAKPYYFVTFLGTQQMNQLAPLTISPKPDTVVRVLMDFTALDKPQVVEPLYLGATPQRKGFTVIEWGGVIRK